MVNNHNHNPIIVVTGGAGYIGSQLIRDLATDPQFESYTIRIYDNLHRQYFSSLMDLPVSGRYEFIKGDILDRLNLERTMRGASTVVHLAAIVHTPLSFDHPQWMEQVNHWGTANVVEAAINSGVTRLLYASSASVYGPGGPFLETDRCHPIGPYAISKRKGEEEVEQGGKRGLPFTVVRLGTTFGNAPALRFDAVANRFVYLAGVRRPLVIHGDGQQMRPLIHTQDAAAVIRFCLAEPDAEDAIINAVTMNPTVNDIAQTVQAIIPDVAIRYTDRDFRTQISYTVDSTKLMDLGFEPRFNLEAGLREMLTRWQGFQPAFSETANLF